ncbi:MAG: MBL fold metallo-hydrolase [Actinomycetales bacterium]|nr:MBL fold metallo-hydrolase [Actinomycetales bacterium]
MDPRSGITRREALHGAARAALLLAVAGGSAACADRSSPRGSSAAPGTGDAADATSGAPSAIPTGPLAWTSVEQTDAAFPVNVSVLVRGDQAVLVDAGHEGSVDSIGTALTGVGVGWESVRYVILTHRHDDHTSGLAEVLERAPAAVPMAAELEVPEIVSPRPITPLRDGDEVFGLKIIDSPGHTQGTISVYDPQARLLVASGAMSRLGSRQGGGLVGSNPAGTFDQPQAADSIRRLADLDVRTVLFGHGKPLTKGADRAIDDLAASL